jgi:hypothetical protein
MTSMESGEVDQVQELQQLKDAAMELLHDSPEISSETLSQIQDIVNRSHPEKRSFISGLVTYLRTKNPQIFEADNLIKSGHELGKSMSVDELHLSDEDKILLEWFRQVRL